MSGASGTPEWRPDPSGRHELRWFDGTAFTDQVADAGVVSTDPGPPSPAGPAASATVAFARPQGPAAPPEQRGQISSTRERGGPAGAGGPGAPPPTLGPPPTAPLPPPGSAPPLPGTPQPPPDLSGKRSSKLPLILAIIGALVVIVALVAIIGGGGGGAGGSGDGEFDGEVSDDDGVSHDITIPAGSVAIIEVNPSDDLDAVVELEIEDDDDRDELLDRYDGTPFEDDDDLLRRDVGYAGDREILFVATPFSIDATVVVSAFDDDSEGDFDLTVEFVELDDIDDDADGDDLLDAVRDDDDVPDAVKDLLDSVLD